MTNIRPATPADRHALECIYLSAFGPAEGPMLAALARALEADETAQPALSLVAVEGDEENAKAIGHVLFTRVTIEPEDEPRDETSQRQTRRAAPQPSPSAQLLAPLAVLESHQRQGVGSALVREGLQQLADNGVQLVFVLGHPEYYPRFGFQPAGALGLEAPYPIAPRNAPAWMVLELPADPSTPGFATATATMPQPKLLGNLAGTVRCAVELDRRELWVE